MKSSVKFGAIVILLMGAGLLVNACVAHVDPSGTPDPEPIGEAEQASQICSSDCSGVVNGIPFSMTCTNSCTADTVSIACDGVYYPCQQNCSPSYGKGCGTLRCTCMSIPKHYDCDGYCVPDYECSCCGSFPC